MHVAALTLLLTRLHVWQVSKGYSFEGRLSKKEGDSGDAIPLGVMRLKVALPYCKKNTC